MAKFELYSVSSLKTKIVECASLDELIYDLREGKISVKDIIDPEYSWLQKRGIETMNFIVHKSTKPGIAEEVTIYDFYLE